MSIIQIIVLCVAVLWAVTALYNLWQLRVQLPQIHRELVRDTAVYNAMQQVPRSHTLAVAIVSVLLAPIACVVFAMDHYGRYRWHRTQQAVRRSLFRMQRLVDSLPDGTSEKQRMREAMQQMIQVARTEGYLDDESTESVETGEQV